MSNNQTPDLTQADIDRFLEKFTIPSCKICQSRSNTIEGYLRGIPRFSDEFNFSDGIKCVVSKCDNCGYLEFFNADTFLNP